MIQGLERMNKNYRLKESKVFCMAPWVSLNSNPNGDIIPCCVATTTAFGNLYQDTIEDIWNNEHYKQFRLDLLNDTPNEICRSCYKSEEWGGNSNYRQYLNDIYSQKYDGLVEETNSDGSLNIMNLYRWDFRFNNLCNLACIGCGPNLSSSWVELQKRMFPESPGFKIYSSRENKEKFINTIKSQVDNVDNIYFAGGEPLMHSEHYEIIEELDRVNKLDQIEFMYSTNLTNLYFKNHYIVDYWNKMKDCKVIVSLDEVDPARLHYIRYPSNIETIINNIKIINENLNTVRKHWSVVPTWNILNTHRMKDIIEYFYLNNLLPHSFSSSVAWEQDMHNIILTNPTHLSISTAPSEWKDHLYQTLNEFEEWYSDVLIPLKNDTIKVFSSEILKLNMNKFRNSLRDVSDPTGFKEYVKRLDESRETDFRKTFPELSWML